MLFRRYMEKAWKIICPNLIISALTIVLFIISCKKTENPIKFPTGTFPDSTFALADLNSAYDDYNTDIHQIIGDLVLVFSSNRASSGGQFDLVQGLMSIVFDQTTGGYGQGSEMTTDPFLTKLLSAANTTRNDFGPYRLYSPSDGYEYLMLASQTTSGDLDLFYLKNLPSSVSSLPTVLGPYSANLLNTASDDAYICFDTNQDSVYFCSNSGGNFDIYLKKKPADKAIDTWLSGAYSAPLSVDSINSAYEDRCPFIYKKIMAFTSNRPGGLGGYDLYYSIFRHGKWSKPANFGPSVNSSSNEFRPVLVSHSDFTNQLLIFSSDRPGGKGRYDLYSKGVTISY
jgi:hypothetical protein